MKRALIILIPLIALLALVGWRIGAKSAVTQAAKQTADQRKNGAAAVVLATAGPKDILNTIQAVGSLESPFQVKLSPNVSGRIDYLEAREGDSVKVGQVLVRIDPQQVEGQILQAQSAVAEARQKYTQAKVTEDANTVSIQVAINQAKAGLASSVADYNEVKTTYDATVGAAHEATVDAEAKVAAANSAIANADANLTLAKANLTNADAKYKRTDTLYRQGFDFAQDLDDANAALKVNQATVNAQQKNVDSATSALQSSEAELSAAEQQESIVRKKGISDILDAKAKVTQGQATLDSAVANRSQIPAYVENLKALQSEVDSAQAALNQAMAVRQFLIVKSSIDGTVTQRLFDPGAEAVPGSPILVVQYLKWLYLTASIPVEYAEEVKVGTSLTMSVDALSGKTFTYTITDVNKSADPTSRQFMIRARMDNAAGLFRPGMYTRLKVVTSVIHAPIVVPLEAVATDTSGNSTATMVDDKMIAHIVPVTVGAKDMNSVQILSGISSGDKVVVLSYRPIKDKSKVSLGGSGKKGKAGAGSKPDVGPDVSSSVTGAANATSPTPDGGQTGGSGHHRHVGGSAGATTTGSSAGTASSTGTAN